MNTSPVPPVIIVGSPRSGTTFLTRSINRFLDIHVARDAGVFLRFYRSLGAYGDLVHADNMRRLIGDLYKDRMFRTRFLERGLSLHEAELFEAVRDRSFAGLVRQVFVETAGTHGKSHWGNKKPSYALHLTETEQIFPGARIVHIVRDGRDVVLSMRKASHLLVEKNWYFAASDWKQHVLGARRAGERLGPGRYLEIKYENLLARPVEVFKELLAFMGMGADAQQQLENIRTGITAKIRADNFDKWRTQMPPSAIRIVERVAGDLLQDLGYPVTHRNEAGKGYNKAQVGLFFIDRAVRNIFTRDFKKLVRTHMGEWATVGRVRLGTLRSRAGTRPGADDIDHKGH